MPEYQVVFAGYSGGWHMHWLPVSQLFADPPEQVLDV